MKSKFRKALREDLVDGFDQDKLARAEFIRPAYKAHSGALRPP